MAEFIDVHDLTNEDVKFVERIVNLLREAREKETKKDVKGPEDGLEVSAGVWKDLIVPEEFKRNVYADRLISTRPEVKL